MVRVLRPGRAALPALLVAALMAGCFGAFAALATPASAAAVPIGQCTTTSGVILAVDFSAFGGSLLRSCGTTPTTGYALLNQGGWHTTGTQHDGPAFVCRIAYAGFQGGAPFPTPAKDPCVVTPPTSAYWSYWHADPGQSTWSYSQQGAMSYHPKPGSVELWTYGSTNTSGSQGGPSFSPSAVRAHNTQPTPGPSKSGSAAPSKPKPSATQPTPTGTKAAPDAGAVTSTSPTASAGAVGSSSSAVAQDGSSAGPSVVDAAPLSGAPPAESSGSPVPLLIGLVLVGAVAAGAGAASWRRRAGSG